MDGVLVDSKPVIQAAAIKTLEEYGVETSPEDFKPFLGPGACLVVEDALNGIEAAKRACMLCAGISTSFSAEEMENAGADFVVNGLDELCGIIANVNGRKIGE